MEGGPRVAFIVVTKGLDYPNAGGRHPTGARYTRDDVRGMLSFMGCKPRHAFKACVLVFQKLERFAAEGRYSSGSRQLWGLGGGEEGSAYVAMPRSEFYELVCSTLTEYNYKYAPSSDEIKAACSLKERRRHIIVLLCGTSGSGKSTLASILAGRLGISTILSTDSVRHMLRGFTTAAETPLLFASTYEAGEALLKQQAIEQQQQQQQQQQQMAAAAAAGAGAQQGQEGQQGQLWQQEGHGAEQGPEPRGPPEGGDAQGQPQQQPQPGPQPQQQAPGPAPAGQQQAEPATAGGWPAAAAPPAPSSAPAAPAPSAPGPVSAHELAIRGYKAQCELVSEQLEALICGFEARRQSLVVEGVHLHVGLVVRLMQRHPGVVPFLVYIKSEGKHVERMAVRAKYMTLDPNKNKYVKNMRNIRWIQDYLFRKAEKHGIPCVENTNIDRSVGLIHLTVLGCLKRMMKGEAVLDAGSSTARMLHAEYAAVAEALAAAPPAAAASGASAADAGAGAGAGAAAVQAAAGSGWSSSTAAAPGGVTVHRDNSGTWQPTRVLGSPRLFRRESATASGASPTDGAGSSEGGPLLRCASGLSSQVRTGPSHGSHGEQQQPHQQLRQQQLQSQQPHPQQQLQLLLQLLPELQQLQHGPLQGDGGASVAAEPAGASPQHAQPATQAQGQGHARGMAPAEAAAVQLLRQQSRASRRSSGEPPPPPTLQLHPPPPSQLMQPATAASPFEAAPLPSLGGASCSGSPRPCVGPGGGAGLWTVRRPQAPSGSGAARRSAAARHSSTDGDAPRLPVAGSPSAAPESLCWVGAAGGAAGAVRNGRGGVEQLSPLSPGSDAGQPVQPLLAVLLQPASAPTPLSAAPSPARVPAAVDAGWWTAAAAGGPQGAAGSSPAHLGGAAAGATFSPSRGPAVLSGLLHLARQPQQPPHPHPHTQQPMSPLAPQPHPHQQQLQEQGQAEGPHSDPLPVLPAPAAPAAAAGALASAPPASGLAGSFSFCSTAAAATHGAALLLAPSSPVHCSPLGRQSLELSRPDGAGGGVGSALSSPRGCGRCAPGLSQEQQQHLDAVLPAWVRQLGGAPGTATPARQLSGCSGAAGQAVGRRSNGGNGGMGLGSGGDGCGGGVSTALGAADERCVECGELTESGAAVVSGDAARGAGSDGKSAAAPPLPAAAVSLAADGSRAASAAAPRPPAVLLDAPMAAAAAAAAASALSRFGDHCPDEVLAAAVASAILDEQMDGVTEQQAAPAAPTRQHHHHHHSHSHPRRSGEPPVAGAGAAGGGSCQGGTHAESGSDSAPAAGPPPARATPQPRPCVEGGARLSPPQPHPVPPEQLGEAPAAVAHAASAPLAAAAAEAPGAGAAAAGVPVTRARSVMAGTGPQAAGASGGAAADAGLGGGSSVSAGASSWAPAAGGGASFLRADSRRQGLACSSSSASASASEYSTDDDGGDGYPDGDGPHEAVRRRRPARLGPTGQGPGDSDELDGPGYGAASPLQEYGSVYESATHDDMDEHCEEEDAPLIGRSNTLMRHLAGALERNRMRASASAAAQAAAAHAAAAPGARPPPPGLKPGPSLGHRPAGPPPAASAGAAARFGGGTPTRGRGREGPRAAPAALAVRPGSEGQLRRLLRGGAGAREAQAGAEAAAPRPEAGARHAADGAVGAAVGEAAAGAQRGVSASAGAVAVAVAGSPVGGAGALAGQPPDATPSPPARPQLDTPFAALSAMQVSGATRQQ